MTKDYAKRRRHHQKKPKNYVYLWLILLLSSAAFITALVIMNKHGHAVPPNLASPQKITTHHKEQAPNGVVTKTPITPKFDFYSIVPQKKDNDIKSSYELEIAIVNDFAAADRLKAELILLGFAVNVTPTYKDGRQKYNVSVGPYNDKDNASIDQHKLQQSKIKSVLKKVS